MLKFSESVRAERDALYEAVGLVKDTECTDAENEMYKSMMINGQPLPDGIHSFKNSDTGEPTYCFYRREYAELTESERLELIELRKFREIRTIKRCIIFFVVLAAIPLSVYAISLIAGLL